MIPAPQAHPPRADKPAQDKPAGKVKLTKAMGAALNAMIIWAGGEPHYRTHGNIPQQMPSTIARTVKNVRVLLKESSK
ncbi:hypothetical protein LCGC14_2725520 [marine sediment metagenome]|uniref:Uncharacterized protein n=1 Tax=marine sediment metagenome TaxID=412755 RepID=A0A0F8Z8T2_9ZZZZ